MVDWTRIAARVRARRAQLRFCLRMTLVVLLSFAVSLMLTIPLHGLWVVLTAVVVTQMSAGGSLRATADYMVGTLSGVLYAGALGVLIPHTTAIEEGGLLALTIAPTIAVTMAPVTPPPTNCPASAPMSTPPAESAGMSVLSIEPPPTPPAAPAIVFQSGPRFMFLSVFPTALPPSAPPIA